MRGPRDQAFAFFLNPNDLSACIDDPHSIEVQDADHFRGTIRAGIGVIKGSFNWSASVVERSPPERAKLRVRGSGMGSGFDIDASLEISEAGGMTTVRWKADIRMNGTIASMGARLLQGTIDKKTSVFFANARKRLETS